MMNRTQQLKVYGIVDRGRRPPNRREQRPAPYVIQLKIIGTVAAGHGAALTIPVNAVLPTGKRNVVFVDKGEGMLEPRFVELGRKYGGDYAVASGLKEGERVVSSANFLIDAEAKVQGALKNWSDGAKE